MTTQTEALKLARKTLALCEDHPWRSQAIAELDKLIEQKSNALAQPKQELVALTNDEREALERFNETCEDGEAYDVPKTMMRRLAEIGVVHHTSRGIYGITKFGRLMLGDTFPPHSKEPEQEPVYVQLRHKTEYGMSEWGSPLDPKERHSKWADGVEMRLLYTTPPQRKPLDFGDFFEWANNQGYDTSHTHDGAKWICLNPMTNDLWKAWQASHLGQLTHHESGMTSDELWLSNGKLRAELADLKVQRKPLTDEQERKAFEDYAVRTICNPVELQRGRLGGYTSQELNYLWRGWKARAAHGIKE